MVITTLLATFVALHWKHNPLIVYSVNGSLLALDLLFFASTATKLSRRRLVPPADRLRHLVPDAHLAQRRGSAMDTVRLEVRQRSQEFIEGNSGATRQFASRVRPSSLDA